MSDDLVCWRCPECGATLAKPAGWPWDTSPRSRPHCPYCLLERVRIVPLVKMPEKEDKQ
jgi:hypothetical protein